MSKLTVKVLEKPCRFAGCESKAFVQVVVQDDPARQKKIDQLGYKKLRETLSKEHKEGKHNA